MKLQRPLESLRATAAKRKAGYIEACLNMGRLDEQTGIVHFTSEGWSLIRTQYRLAEPSFPSVKTMARNAVGASARVAAAAVKGEPVYVSQADFEARAAICPTCEFYIEATQRCSRCGCNMISKVFGKARLATEECPANKWPALTPLVAP